MNDIITVASEAAREAGLFLKSHFGAVHTVHTKSDHELVTDLDRQAEAMIVARIKQAFPGHSILAEEGSGAQTSSDYLWIIDPIDGTHNFIRNIGLFGVSIGIVYKNEHIAGTIYMPCDDALYAAEKGSGAWKNKQKISVSSTKTLGQCTLAYDSCLFSSNKQILPVLKNFAREVFNVRMLGSSVRNLTYLADGSVDACIEFEDKPLDSAGGITIIREAGGMVTTHQGAPFTFKDDNYVASNTLLHPHLLTIVKNSLL